MSRLYRGDDPGIPQIFRSEAGPDTPTDKTMDDVVNMDHVVSMDTLQETS